MVESWQMKTSGRTGRASESSLRTYDVSPVSASVVPDTAFLMHAQPFLAAIKSANDSSHEADPSVTDDPRK